jgi:hypothetical protein
MEICPAKPDRLVERRKRRTQGKISIGPSRAVQRAGQRVRWVLVDCHAVLEAFACESKSKKKREEKRQQEPRWSGVLDSAKKRRERKVWL